MFLGLPDLDPDPLVRCMDPALDPDPDPSLFFIKVMSGLKYCLQNKILTQNLSKKSNLRLKIMCLSVKVIRKKYVKKKFFLLP
jgi:hypothetical protein